MAGHKDDLAHEPWLAVAHMDAREGLGKIFLAAPLNPKDLAPLVKEKEIITWDTEHGGLIATQELRIGNIVLKSTPLPEPAETDLVAAISDAIKKEGKQLLNFDDDFIQWQNRILSIRRWRPELLWPDTSTNTLLLTNNEWLAPFLIGIKKPADLKKLKLRDHPILYPKQNTTRPASETCTSQYPCTQWCNDQVGLSSLRSTSHSSGKITRTFWMEEKSNHQ